MSDEDARLENLSIQWLRTNKRRIKREICDTEKYPPEDNPSTIFMAGTPGAGKTEFSKSLIEAFNKPMVRIDADEIRDMMREIGYDGSNAPIFQRAVGNSVNNLYGSVLQNKQSVLIDGTFAYGNWKVNIERSLEANRIVELYYLYQDPLIAWEFVKARQMKQGRHVPKDVFIHDYFTALDNVTEAKKLFANKLTVYFAKNNYKKDLEYLKIDVMDVAKLVPKAYTKDELIACLI